jgi:hypothetical protein
LDVRRWVTFSRAGIMMTEDGCTFSQIAPLERAPAAAAISGQRVAYASNQEDARGIFASRITDAMALAGFERVAIPGDEQILWTGLMAGRDGELIASGYIRSAGSEQGAGVLWRLPVSGAPERIEMPEGAKYVYLMASGEHGFAGIMGLEQDQVAFWFVRGEDGSWVLKQHVLERWPSGMVLDQAGRVLRIAGVDIVGGLWRGMLDEAGEVSWQIDVADHAARCIGRVGDDVLLCAHRLRQEHDISLITGEQDWEVKLSYRDLLGPRRGCSAGSQVRQVCPAVWRELALALRVPHDREPPELDPPPVAMEPIPDMGGSPDRGESPRPPEPTSGDSRGCASAPAARLPSWTLLMLLTLLMARRSSREGRLSRATDRS